MVEVQDALSPMKNFKFGCDPELFIQNDKGDYVSAEGLLPGTKSDPFPVEHGAVQVDGMAAEFNIDPVNNFKDFNRNIAAVLDQLKGMLPTGYTLHAVPAVTFNESVWESAPPKAKELGCSPDFNAWTGMVNPPPNDPENPRLRTASGHLHIGWTDDQSTANLQHIVNCQDLVKQLDWYLGAWSLTQDHDPTRRRLYGQAGACRYKPYGVEYRVLSNFWVLDETTRLEVWNRMNSAIKNMRTNYFPDIAKLSTRYKFNDSLIQSINESNLDTRLLSKFVFPIANWRRN